MKRDVTKLTKNTFYIDMEEYYGEDSIKRISKEERMIGEELTEYLYKKLFNEFKMFLCAKMQKQAEFDEDGRCVQILIIEYHQKTWVLRLNHHKFLQHSYKDCYGNWHTILPFGTGKTFIREEKDEWTIDTVINILEK